MVIFLLQMFTHATANRFAAVDKISTDTDRCSPSTPAESLVCSCQN